MNYFLEFPGTAVLPAFLLGSGALGAPAAELHKKNVSALRTAFGTDFDFEPNNDYNMFTFLTYMTEYLKKLSGEIVGEIPVGSHLWCLLFLVNFALACFFLNAMMGGGGWSVGRGQHMPPGVTTLKSPPSWGPEQAQHYPYIQYVNDMMLWSLATDMERIREGPAAAMQLTGAAKLVSRQLIETADGLLRLQQGDQDGAGNNRTGLMILLEALGPGCAFRPT